MTDKRKKELEELAKQKAFNIIVGDTTAFESEFIGRQVTLGLAEYPQEDCPEDCEPCELYEPYEEPPPPTTPEEKEVYYRGMIINLAREGKKARNALLDIVKFIFNLSPDETARFMMDQTGGYLGINDYSTIVDVVRKFSQIPQAEEIRKAFKNQEAKHREYQEKLETIQETIEDRNRQRHEQWATVPECIRAVIDMAEVERTDGKNIPSPGNYDTLRINVSKHLKKNEKRLRGSYKKPYYQTADIAEAVAIFYKAFDTKQYITEFSRIGINGADVPDTKQKKAEHAKQSRGVLEDQ